MIMIMIMIIMIIIAKLDFVGEMTKVAREPTGGGDRDFS